MRDNEEIFNERVLWENDTVQFARVLVGLHLVGKLTDQQRKELSMYLELTSTLLNNIFVRANVVIDDLEELFKVLRKENEAPLPDAG